MADKETGVSRIDQVGESFRVRGVHQGVPSDVMIPKAHVEYFRKEGGEKAVQAYLERSLSGGRVDRVYDPHTGELRGD